MRWKSVLTPTVHFVYRSVRRTSVLSDRNRKGVTPMSRTSAIDVLVSEVGPREGQQAIHQVMPTQTKLRWIAALADAGLREIEATSFVSPKAVPQMADAAEIVTGTATIQDLRVLCLVPNLRGAQ